MNLWKNQEYYPINSKNVIIRWLKKLPKNKILDEGCGTGRYTISLSMLGFKKIVGLDFSKKLLKIARKNAKKYKCKCRFIKGDIRELPFKKESFDIVLSAGIVEHVPETQQCIKEIARVLRQRGYLIIHVPHRISFFTINKLLQQLFGVWSSGYEKSFTKSYFRKLLEKNNFKILTEITSEIEGKTFITKILKILDKPLYTIGLGGHHIHFLCQKI